MELKENSAVADTKAELAERARLATPDRPRGSIVSIHEDDAQYIADAASAMRVKKYEAVAIMVAHFRATGGVEKHSRPSPL